jgi:hypothetical protein
LVGHSHLRNLEQSAQLKEQLAADLHRTRMQLHELRDSQDEERGRWKVEKEELCLAHQITLDEVQQTRATTTIRAS